MSIRERLIDHQAPLALKLFAKDKSLLEVVETCPRGDWLNFMAFKFQLCGIEQFTLIKAKQAEVVQDKMSDPRSIAAIEAAHQFAKGQLSPAEMNAAAHLAIQAGHEHLETYNKEHRHFKDYPVWDFEAPFYDAFAPYYAAVAADQHNYYFRYHGDHAARADVLKQTAEICRQELLAHQNIKIK